MIINKRAEEALLARVPAGCVVKFRHWRFPGLRTDYPSSGRISKKNGMFAHLLTSDKLMFDVYGYNQNGGKTTCTIYEVVSMPSFEEGAIDTDKIAIAKGESFCSFSDAFCKRTGRTIALGRALAMMENDND